jgi:pimeloyl-ACP methyl ester carboxylesterase
LWPNAREGFDNLFRACRDQPACRRRHPGLAQTFARLVRRLEAHPLTARVQPAAGKPTVKVVLDGGALVNWLVTVVVTNSDSAIRSVPAAIGDLAAGRPQAIAAARAAFTTLGGIGLVGYGLQYGVACSEWIRPASDVLRQGRGAFPGYPDSVVAQAPQLPFINGDCRAWDVPKAPSTERAVTRNSIPTLVMAGTFDAATPPSQGKVAARTLPNSTLVTIPGSGHQVILASSCARRVLASFLSSPAAPNTRCVAGLRPPTFAASPTIAAAEGLEPPTPGS